LKSSGTAAAPCALRQSDDREVPVGDERVDARPVFRGALAGPGIQLDELSEHDDARRGCPAAMLGRHRRIEDHAQPVSP
jgi:hypothetical protein